MPTDALPRVPDSLLTAKLPAPALRLWLAVRKRQGDNGSTWQPLAALARMADVKEKDAYRWRALLVDLGWLVLGEGRHIRCALGRPYAGGRRGGKTTPKEGGTTTPKEGGSAFNPERIQKESRHGGEPSATDLGPARHSDLDGPAATRTPGLDSDSSSGCAAAPDGEPGGEPGGDGSTDGFAEFWAAYGRREGKARARTAWRRLSAADRRAVMAHLPGFVASTPELRYRPHASTYLHGRRWEDEDLPPVDAGPDLTGPLTPGERDAAIRLHGLAPADFYRADTDHRTGLPVYRRHA